MKKVSVLLAISSTYLQRSLERVLNIEGWIEVVGNADSSAETLKLSKELKPQIVILDDDLAEEGLETGFQLIESFPHIKLIILSESSVERQADDRAKNEGLLFNKRVEFLTKQASVSNLIAAISNLRPKNGHVHY